TAPVHLVGGWHDLFLISQLEDYAALRAAGQDPYLTVGPWIHVDPPGLGTAITEALTWFRAHVTGDRSGLRAKPVRLYVQGAAGRGGWSGRGAGGGGGTPGGPRPGGRGCGLLRPGGAWAPAPPVESAPARFTYDPADPTPGVGGPLLDPRASGRRDQAEVEV